MAKVKKTNEPTLKTRHLGMRYRVMDLVHKNPDITQRELANKLGISLGSIHYCLRALIQKGCIKMGNFKRNPNKSGYVYFLTSEGITLKTKLGINFLRRKKEEYEEIKSEIDELSASIHEEVKVRKREY